jgi:WD40 repeat protein
MADGSVSSGPTNWATGFDKRSCFGCKSPTRVAFSPRQNLLAVVYISSCIFLWDYVQNRVHHVYEQETGSSRFGTKRVFPCSCPDVKCLKVGMYDEEMLLAADFFDGSLSVYNTCYVTLRGKVSNVNVGHVCCSSDGRTLACVTPSSTMKFIDLKTMVSSTKLRTHMVQGVLTRLSLRRIVSGLSVCEEESAQSGIQPYYADQKPR